MRIVIALGGNALGDTPEEQQKLVKEAMGNIVPLIKEGHEIVIGHGNGPQVGIINLAFAESSMNNEKVPSMPLTECTAMSQGYIGFHIQKALKEALNEANIKMDVCSLVTQVSVDESDESFKNPTKPVGPFYTKEIADKLGNETGDTYIEDAGRGYRKVVASPKPLEIKELNTVKTLLANNHIVIAAGGGGIPVFKQNPLIGASAVIDKDLVSSLMAKELDADLLIILTNIKQAQLYYGTDKAEKIGKITINEAETYINEGHFAKGSMEPKIKAAIEFVKYSNNKAIITSLNNLSNSLKGIDATIITK